MKPGLEPGFRPSEGEWTKYDSSGRLLLEPKDHIKQRVGFSPDLGDAAALTFAVDFTWAVVDGSLNQRGGRKRQKAPLLTAVPSARLDLWMPTAFRRPEQLQG